MKKAVVYDGSGRFEEPPSDPQLRSSRRTVLAYQSSPARRGAKAASTPAAPAEDETAAGAMSTYEMRKFLQQSQRFFLSVNKDAAFAQPSHSAEGKPMNRARAGLA